MPRFYISARARLGVMLALSSLVSVVLLAAGIWHNNSWQFAFLAWNLFLAWIPLGLSFWLVYVLRSRLWSSWLPLLLTVLWVSFLPNSFYLITDYIHLQEPGRADLLFDVVMFTSFVFNGVILGYLSLYMVHTQLLQRVSGLMARLLIGGVLLASSFAIYIGRELRWNTWDVVVNPASLLFDVSDRVLNPGQHPQAFTTTAIFFILLASTYWVIWFAAGYIARSAQTSQKG